MKIDISKPFRKKLNSQIEYITKDKPGAARKFKDELLKRIKEIPTMPYQNRKSIFFDDDKIRDMVYKGYIVVYRIVEKDRKIQVFGFTKYEEDLHI
jgi:plasmid stabilization system protein ParE